MPRQKQTAKPENARVAIVEQIMVDFETMIPPIDSGTRDGFEHVDHPEGLKEVWKVANRFPPISVANRDRDSRAHWYAEFRQVLKVQGAFRKNTARNRELWDRIQSRLKTLEATG